MDISFIIPLYRGKRYIPHIIEMVKENQKVLMEHKLNIEIEVIFVNDFPDEEINDIDLCCYKNIPLQFYKNQYNLGIHGSRVKGLSKAKGKYIIFLDQDDEISHYYLYRQLKYIKQANAVLCNGVYRGNRIIYRDIEHQKRVISKYNFLKQGNYIVSPGQVMVKHEAIPIKWKENILKENGSDDALLWILMLCQEEIFAINPYLDYLHTEEGENASLNFEGMKSSSEELLSVIQESKLLNEKDFKLFEEILLERIKKHDKYNEILENWTNILNRLVELCGLKKRIAIYGYGIIGKKLIHDLEEAGIRIDFVIDKSADNFREINYKVYKPEDIPREVEFIIITPLFAEKQIREELKRFKLITVSLGSLK